ncbi:MAG: flagellin [Spirochaetia bacterium]|nr:flagellin [Spirochaetia bacterium]
MHDRPRFILACLAALALGSATAQDFSALDFLARELSARGPALDDNLRRLSSGLMLWTDDPASRAIFEKVVSNVGALSAAIRNSADLASYHSVRDGWLATVAESLQRVRELVVARAGGILADDDRALLDAEMASHFDAVRKTFERASFNGVPLFAGGEESLFAERFEAPEFRTLAGVDRALSAVIAERARTGALLGALDSNARGLSVERENASGLLSRGDVDFAAEISAFKAGEILFLSNLLLLGTARR